MNYKDIVAWLGTIVGGTCTGVSMATMNQVIVICNLVLTIIATIVSLVYTIWKWWKKAKADGKITEDEVDDLMDDIKDITDKDKKGE